MLLDLRYCLRTLARSPAFTIVAILTLALGIGANTAIFTVFNSVLLRPLPYPGAGRLVTVEEVVPKFARFGPSIPVTAWHFQEWRKQSRAFDSLALVGDLTFTLTSGGDPERVRAQRVSASLFPLLGIQAALGRTFLEDEDRPGRDQVVILSDRLWRRRFHRDPEVVGRKILLDGVSYEVIGILPPSARIPAQGHLQRMATGTAESDIWKPFAISRGDLQIMSEFNYGCLGRLRSGVSITQAVADLNMVQSAIVSGLDEKTELRAAVSGLQEQMTSGSRSGLMLLLAAAAAVLLIIVVNLANLMLARASGRRRELAIRSAIGAGLGRLIRQAMTESLLLALAGGTLGALAARWALAAIIAKAPLDIPGLRNVSMDLKAFLFLAAVSLASGALFGILPAWRMARSDPQASLKSAGASITDRSSGRLRSLLITAEVAISAVCLVAGGLLLNSFVRLLNVDKGFQPDHASATALGLPQGRYHDSASRVRFVNSLLDRVAALPGVSAAGISNRGPLSGEGSNLGIDVEGVNIPSVERPIVDYRCVTPGFFRAMGIPLVTGRLMSESDQANAVSVVSAQAAARLWPNQNAIGRRFHLGTDYWIEVVGVVGDVRSTLSKTPNPTVYLPFWQRDRSDFSLIVRTAVDPQTLGSPLRAAIHELDPQLVVPQARTLADIVDASVLQRRFQLSLVFTFAIAALLLAAIGVYGVVAQSVTERTREFGIRMALGAPRRHLWRVVALNSLAPVAAGLGAGLTIAMAATRSIRGLLFGVSATDPETYLAVIAVLLAAAALATYVPARRATRVDPLTALRSE